MERYFQGLKDKTLKAEFFAKIPSENEGKITTFQIHRSWKNPLPADYNPNTIRNVQSSPIGRREIISDGNLNLQKGVKITKNNYYLKSLKHLFKAKI